MSLLCLFYFELVLLLKRLFSILIGSTNYIVYNGSTALQWNPACRGRRVSGHPLYRGRSLGICFFRFKNNPAYRGAIHLTGHFTEDFFT